MKKFGTPRAGAPGSDREKVEFENEVTPVPVVPVPVESPDVVDVDGVLVVLAWVRARRVRVGVVPDVVVFVVRLEERWLRGEPDRAVVPVPAVPERRWVRPGEERWCDELRCVAPDREPVPAWWWVGGVPSRVVVDPEPVVEVVLEVVEELEEVFVGAVAGGGVEDDDVVSVAEEVVELVVVGLVLEVGDVDDEVVVLEEESVVQLYCRVYPTGRSASVTVGDPDVRRSCRRPASLVSLPTVAE